MDKVPSAPLHDRYSAHIWRTPQLQSALTYDGLWQTAKGIVAEMNGPAKLVSLNHATNGERALTKSRFIPHALDGQTTYSAQGRLQD
jgi:hypothetical protein